jgi:DnaJ-class molecular chaperone
MIKRLNCNCQKTPGCKLCHGTGKYDYEVGPAGWQPFRCPNCDGKRTIDDAASPDGKKPCPTCKGQGLIDPANPPGDGFWDKLSKIFFGA